MKSARLVLTAAIAMGAVTGLTACAENPSAMSPDLEMPVADVSMQPADASSPAAAAILQAAEPSAAIQAYASAQAADRDSVAVESAYLQRMVQFGLPEMADTQAQDLVRRDPDNGLAWAVAGYMSGKRADMPAALGDIAVATRRLPDDPFVQRTAGQLLAWYDVQANKAQLPQSAQQSAEATRSALANRPLFADAYKDAIDAMKQPTTQPGAAAAAPETSPAETAAPITNPAEPPSTYTYQPGSAYYPETTYQPSYYDTYNYYPSYSYPYASAYGYPDYYPGYYSYAPWWPDYCTWGGDYWWPSFGAGFYFGYDYHHHDHDYDHHHGHGYNGHGYNGHGYNGHGVNGGRHAVFNNNVFANSHLNGSHFAHTGALRNGFAAGHSAVTPFNHVGVATAPRGSALPSARGFSRGSITTITPHGSFTTPLHPGLASPSARAWRSPSTISPGFSRGSLATPHYYSSPYSGGRVYSSPSYRSYAAPRSFAPSRGFAAPSHSFGGSGFHSYGGGFHSFGGGGGFHGGGGGFHGGGMGGHGGGGHR